MALEARALAPVQVRALATSMATSASAAALVALVGQEDAAVRALAVQGAARAQVRVRAMARAAEDLEDLEDLEAPVEAVVLAGAVAAAAPVVLVAAEDLEEAA